MKQRLHTETRLNGLPLSSGCGVARVCLFNEQRHSNLPMYHVSGTGVDREAARAEQAFALAATRLDAIRAEVEKRIGRPEAGIFVAQKMILEDAAVRDQILQAVRDEHVNAETAVARVLDRYESRLLELDNEYLKERASDIGEIKRRLLDVLRNMNPDLQCNEEHCQRGRNRVVVAEELTPALTVELDTTHIKGFVTERGGQDSHGAILARALGVPAVSGIEGIRGLVSCGTEILVNGYTGEVVVWPEQATIVAAREAHPESLETVEAVEPTPGFKVLANIGAPGDVVEALKMKAEGIGLYRTEIELIASGRLFTEDELAERYTSVASAFDGQVVIFRLFDIGSDKVLPTLQLPAEENPALGWRGSRLLLDREDLMKAQARALARLSRGQEQPVHVLYPMVVDLDQFRRLKAAFLDLTADLAPRSVRHGVLFEVPSACLDANRLMREADFASIGTNDLTQYLFAVDRNNDRVAQHYRPDRPAFWDLVRRVARAARKEGKPLSVCGELANDPRYVPKWRRAGIEMVSVSPRLIPGVRVAATRKGPRSASKTAAPPAKPRR